jgi:hypothetical protein
MDRMNRMSESREVGGWSGKVDEKWREKERRWRRAEIHVGKNAGEECE